MTPRGRWSLIALGAIATGIAYYFSPDKREPHAVAPLATRGSATIVELPEYRALGRQRGDLFAPYSPKPPAPPPAPPAPAQIEPPQPPPHAYRYAGSVEYGGRRRILFARADRIFEVDEGATLEGGFRVQSVTAQEVTLLYEPLKASVSIALVFQEPPPQAAAASGPSAPQPQLPVPAASPLPPGSPLKPAGVVGSGARPPH